MSHLTVKQLKERWQQTEASILYLIKTHQLRALNLGREPNGKKPRWRIPLAEVERFEAERSNQPPPKQQHRRRKKDADFIEYF